MPFIPFFLALVLFFSLPCSANPYLVRHKCDHGFTIKGCDLTFQDNPPTFPIELGDSLIVEKEKREYLNNHSYRVIYKLHSQEHNKSQEFMSNIIDESEYVFIVKAIETARFFTYDAISNDGRRFIYWYDANVAYDLYLEDGSLYKLFYNQYLSTPKKTDPKKLNRIYLDPIVVADGDIMALGRGELAGCGNYYRRFSARILHAGSPLPYTCSVVGFVREPEKMVSEEEGKKFKVVKSFSDYPWGLWNGHTVPALHLDDFGRGVSTSLRPTSGIPIDVGTELTFVRKEGPALFVFKNSDNEEVQLSWHIKNYCDEKFEDIAAAHRGM